MENLAEKIDIILIIIMLIKTLKDTRNMKKKLIIFIDTMFGYQKGGCSTVNYELCLALKQIAFGNIEVISLVVNCNKDDRVETLEPVSYTHLDVYKRQDCG